MNVSLVKPLSRIFLFILATLLPLRGIAAAPLSPRQIIADAILADDDARRRELILSLTGQGDEAIKVLLAAWKEDALFI